MRGLGQETRSEPVGSPRSTSVKVTIVDSTILKSNRQVTNIKGRSREILPTSAISPSAFLNSKLFVQQSP